MMYSVKLRARECLLESLKMGDGRRSQLLGFYAVADVDFEEILTRSTLTRTESGRRPPAVVVK